MHNKLKRVCSLAVLLAMLTQMAACSNTDVSDTKETTAETKSATADNTEITEATEEDTKLCPNLPSDLKFDGEEVRIMQHLQAEETGQNGSAATFTQNPSRENLSTTRYLSETHTLKTSLMLS